MSVGDGRSGVMRAAVAAAAGDLAQQRAAAAPEQLTMLPVPIGNPRAKHLRRDVDRKREAGRPPGATNISTRELREWLLRRGIHPLQQLFLWAQHTPQSLAAELGCSQLEAYNQLRQSWADLLPYLAPKMAPVDPLGNVVTPFVQFNVGGHQVIAQGQQTPWEWREQRVKFTQQNQMVVDAVPAVSHAAVSHEEPK